MKTAPSSPIPIIMLNWNGIEDTLACWSSLQKQTCQDFCLYLVDNGSEQSEVKVLRDTFADQQNVELILNPSNLGFTAGNNLILRQLLMSTESAYIVLLNNDTVTEPDWLENLISAAVRQDADMVASRMIDYERRERMDNAGHVLLNTLEVLPLGHGEPISRYDVPLENAGACGGAALYSTAMLRQIGIFDAHFSNGYEDVELGLRALLCGYRCVYEPTAVVYHKGSKSINKIRDVAYNIGIQRNIYYITGKLFPVSVLIICAPLMGLRFILGILINLLTLRWKFLRIQITALQLFLTRDWAEMKKARKIFHQTQRILPAQKILGKTKFFLKYDWNRFVKYIIRREKTVFERTSN